MRCYYWTFRLPMNFYFYNYLCFFLKKKLCHLFSLYKVSSIEGRRISVSRKLYYSNLWNSICTGWNHHFHFVIAFITKTFPTDQKDSWDQLSADPSHWECIKYQESLFERTEMQQGLTHCFISLFPSGCALEHIMWEYRGHIPCSSHISLLCVAIVLRMLFWKYAKVHSLATQYHSDTKRALFSIF